jgi:hypothetical protein
MAVLGPHLIYVYMLGIFIARTARIIQQQCFQALTLSQAEQPSSSHSFEIGTLLAESQAAEKRATAFVTELLKAHETLKRGLQPLVSKWSKFLPRDQAVSGPAAKRPRTVEPLPPGRVKRHQDHLNLQQQRLRRQADEQSGSDSPYDSEEENKDKPTLQTGSPQAPAERTESAERQTSDKAAPSDQPSRKENAQDNDNESQHPDLQPTDLQMPSLSTSTAASQPAATEGEQLRTEATAQTHTEGQASCTPPAQQGGPVHQNETCNRPDVQQPPHNCPPPQPSTQFQPPRISQVFSRPPNHGHPHLSTHMHPQVTHQPTPITPSYMQMQPMQTWMGPGPHLGPGHWQQQLHGPTHFATAFQAAPWQQLHQHQLHHPGQFAGPQQQHPSFGPSFCQAPAACGLQRPMQHPMMQPLQPQGHHVPNDTPAHAQFGPGPASAGPPQQPLPSFFAAKLNTTIIRTDPANILLEAEDDQASVSGTAGEAEAPAPVEATDRVGQHSGKQQAPQRPSDAAAETQQSTTHPRPTEPAAPSRLPGKGSATPTHQLDPPWRERRGTVAVDLKPAANKSARRARTPSESEADDPPDPLYLAVQKQIEAATAPPGNQHQPCSRPTAAGDWAPPKSRPLGPPAAPPGHQQRAQQHRQGTSSKGPAPKMP